MKGTILEFRGSWMSGLATLIVQHEDGSIVPVFCDNAPTVRALAEAFGEDVIGEAHTVNNEALKGKVIDYKLDDMGLVLEYFRVPEEAGQ